MRIAQRRPLRTAATALPSRPQGAFAAAPRSVGHDFGALRISSHSSPVVQAALTVGQPQDQYEREADEVANQVVRGTVTDPVAPASGVPRVPAIQRLAAHLDPSLEDITVREEEAETVPQAAGVVQRLRAPGRTGDGSAVPAGPLRQTSGGTPLDQGTRAAMESSFGADFSRVRVHADGRAAALSRSLGARAFTHGRDIYFDANEYQPSTVEGRQVLAHELTHVVQQGAAPSALPLRQVSSGPGAYRTPSVQRLRAPGRALRHNVYPWGDPGPVGSNHEVETDAGSRVTAWIGYLVQPQHMLYWCHGHSTDSYLTFGYSVYSGADFAKVVRDEWTNIPPDKTQAGDIAVWTGRFDHSAKFTSPVVTNGQLDGTASQLSTKNGQASLTTMSLAGLAGIYGTTGIAVYRHV